MAQASPAIAETSDGSITARFEGALYSATAVKKAAYKFAADCGVVLTTADGDVVATLKFPESVDSENKNKITRSFCNEVIDQDLRESIARETEGTRNLILAQAFSKTTLLEEG